MKKYIFSAFIACCMLTFSACSNDDKLSEKSVLVDPEVDNSAEGIYLRKTFTDPFNMKVVYKWDRNQYGDSRDVLRNLYPAKRANIIPAMEMVDHVWIKTYQDVIGDDFVNGTVKGPYEIVLAGGMAINDDESRTLGLASSGVRITLFELDYIMNDPAQAREFIHTIQHEYIHIITQDHEFVEREYGKQTMGDYNPDWTRTTMRDAREKGFITPYATNNIFEDFAEMASFLLANDESQWNAVLESFKETASNGAVSYRPGRAKLEYKAQFIRDYFTENFNVNFDELARVANENADSSPMLNPGGSGRGIATSPYGLKMNNTVKHCQHDLFWEKKLELKSLNN